MFARQRHIAAPLTKAKFWLSVGDEETATGILHAPGLFQEMFQIEGVKRAVKTFEALGARVKYNMYCGGRTIAAWREELTPALKWLIGGSENCE